MTSAPTLTVRRVTTTRAGGFSAPPYESFNLGDHVGDDPATVRRNRDRLAAGIGLTPDRLVWMEQIHSRNVEIIDGPRAEPVPATDALVTNVPGLALVVLTADCVPLLLSDDEAGVLAAVHAGRIGARIGIVPRVLDAMLSLGAQVERIGAFLGPAASGRQYEVPAAMRADVEAHLPGSATTTARRRSTCAPESAGSSPKPGSARSRSTRAAPSRTTPCSVTAAAPPRGGWAA